MQKSGMMASNREEPTMFACPEYLRKKEYQVLLKVFQKTKEKKTLLHSSHKAKGITRNGNHIPISPINTDTHRPINL